MSDVATSDAGASDSISGVETSNDVGYPRIPSSMFGITKRKFPKSKRNKKKRKKKINENVDNKIKQIKNEINPKIITEQIKDNSFNTLLKDNLK